MRVLRTTALAAALAAMAISTPVLAQYHGPGRGYRSDNYADWVPLGRMQFDGPRDHEVAFTGWGGRQVDMISLRAVNSDAYCRGARVTFGNRTSRYLDFQGYNTLVAGKPHALNLGAVRNVIRLDLECRALDRRSVTIEVMARK